jgi:hypothetical protein
MNKPISVRIQLSVPAPLYLALSKAAQKAKRTPEADILSRLQQSLEVGASSGKTRESSEAVVAELSDLRDSVDQILKRINSERALIRSVALAVVSSIDLARKQETGEVSTVATSALLALRELAQVLLNERQRDRLTSPTIGMRSDEFEC